MQNKTRNEAAFSRRDFGKLAIAGLPLSMALWRGSKVNGVRIGVQSYSFRTLSLDDAIKAMKDIGIPECELFSGHVEPRASAGAPAPGGGRPKPGRPWKRCAKRSRKWRLDHVPLDHFKGHQTEIRSGRDQTAGLQLQLQ